MKKFFLLSAVLMLAVSCGKTKSGLDPKDFKSSYNGKATALYTLSNRNGMEVCITNFGGRIVSVMAPNQFGGFMDVVLGFDNIKDYFPENNDSNFGAAIGRYGNRIAKGKFSIDGTEYQVPCNNGENHLHGGPTGFHYQVFDVVEHNGKHVKLHLDSPDGDNGFPGNLSVYITYTLTEDNRLELAYEATTDKPTVVNLTNHSYFNLSGDPANHSIIYDELIVNADYFTPTDSGLIPTGEIRPVKDTPMDLRFPRTIGDVVDIPYEPLQTGNGIDHNFVLNTKGDITKSAATLHCDETGIMLSVYTDEPGLQVYTGNFLNGSVVGKKGVAYPFRSAVCLEPQHFPDSPNHPEWASVVLRPGKTYTSHCTYAFNVLRIDKTL